MFDQTEFPAAFAEWLRRYQEDPSAFMSWADSLAEEPASYGEGASLIMVRILNELRPASEPGVMGP